MLTLGLLFSGRDKISVINALGFIIAQVLGAIVGGLVAAALVGHTVSGQLYVGHWLSGTCLLTFRLSTFAASIGELLWSFLLTLVFLNVATTHSLEKNMFYGLAIGFTVLVGSFVVGRIGAFFNPAVAIGFHLPACIWSKCWIRFVPIYLICGPVGALLASLVFRFANSSEYHLRWVFLSSST